MPTFILIGTNAYVKAGTTYAHVVDFKSTKLLRRPSLKRIIDYEEKKTLDYGSVHKMLPRILYQNVSLR